VQAEELIVEVICLALKWIHLSEWLPHRMNTIINLVAETIRVVETTMECKIWLVGKERANAHGNYKSI